MQQTHKNTLLKVVILGDGGVGKSCLMNRFVSNQFDEHSFHTIGVEFMNKDIEVDGENYTLQIWDTAGQERFRALRTPFYRGSDVCLLTYAVDDRDGFLALKEWHKEFLHYADVAPDRFPFIVVGNKADVSPADRTVSPEEAEVWCRDNHITCWIETSARTALNVKEAFEMAVKQWIAMERTAEIETRVDPTTVNLRLNEASTKSNSGGCCSMQESD